MLETSFTLQTLKLFGIEQQIELAQEIRNVIITTVSRTGGHLASSLGVVEIAIALHYVFDAPEDKIIWDVGHQCYPHKLLTGRWDRFDTLRQQGGIAGFPKPSESQYDAFGTGHSGTSISAALGMAVRRDLAGKSYKVLAVVGDASLTNGMALEAINHAGYARNDIIVVLNDNEKSISRNVGAYSRYLSRLRMELLYRNGGVDEKKMPPVLSKNEPEAVNGVLSQLKQRARHILTPSRTGAVFEELGFKYLGPVDGHDISELCAILESAKRLKGPVLVHTVTSKGKGYRYAEEDPTGFHGVGSFNQENGKIEISSTSVTFTSVFGDTLVRLARQQKDVVAITAAMKDGTGLRVFKDEFPSRFFDVGIAEEHAVTFAAGLAKEGARPFVAIYSTFLQRAYDQILHDVCLQRLPVRFIVDRSGLVGEDGPTHHGAFDLTYLRSMPHMVIMAPKDENELQHMIKTAVEYNEGPVAVRFPRGKGFGVFLDEDTRALEIPSWEIVKTGRIVAVLATGSTVHPAIEAAKVLEKEGMELTVVNARFIKPLDAECIKNIASTHSCLLTVEENTKVGGFGSAVLEVLADMGMPVRRICRIGLPDSFVEHGSQDLLRSKYGLNAEGIVSSLRVLAAEQGLSWA